MTILDRWMMMFFSIMKGLRAMVVARLRIWYWHGGSTDGEGNGQELRPTHIDGRTMYFVEETYLRSQQGHEMSGCNP